MNNGLHQSTANTKDNLYEFTPRINQYMQTECRSHKKHVVFAVVIALLETIMPRKFQNGFDNRQIKSDDMHKGNLLHSFCTDFSFVACDKTIFWYKNEFHTGTNISSYFIWRC